MSTITVFTLHILTPSITAWMFKRPLAFDISLSKVCHTNSTQCCERNKLRKINSSLWASKKHNNNETLLSGRTRYIMLNLAEYILCMKAQPIDFLRSTFHKCFPQDTRSRSNKWQKSQLVSTNTTGWSNCKHGYCFSR